MFNFKEIDLTSLIPGTNVEINARNTIRGLPGNLQKIVIIAQKTAAGILAVLKPTAIFSSLDASTLAGIGSTAHLMAIACLTANQNINLSLCLLDDAGASTAHVVTTTLTGDATGPGVNVIDLNNVQIEAAYATDDTPTEQADALVARAAEIPALPYIYDNVAGVITATAKNTGTTHNQDNHAFFTTAGQGVSGVVVDTTPGAVDPDLQTALDAIHSAGDTLIVTPYNLTADLQDVRDHLDSVSNGEEMRGARSIAALTTDIASATTAALAVNSGRLNILNYRGSKSAAWQIAAAGTAAEAVFQDPALPRRGMKLAGIHNAPLDQLYSATEQKAMLRSGVSPLTVGVGEVVEIVRHVSTQTLNSEGNPDNSLLDTSTIATLDYTREVIRQRLDADFSDTKATDNTVKAVRTAIIDEAKKLEAAEIIENVDEWDALLIVERDPNEVTRIRYKFPDDVVNPLMQVFGVHDLIL